jgi:hypothetical protein
MIVVDDDGPTLCLVALAGRRGSFKIRCKRRSSSHAIPIVKGEFIFQRRELCGQLIEISESQLCGMQP